MMALPDRRQCLQMLDAHGVPAHIVEHSLRVAQVGRVLTACLQTAGRRVDFRLVEAGSLLHDIMKMKSLQSGGDHAEEGGSLLEGLGYPEVAEVVRRHVYLTEPLRRPEDICGVHVVHYADKRVRHTEVVTLSERFEDLCLRYGKTVGRKAKILGLYEESLALESLIFEGLQVSPEALNGLNRYGVEEDAPVLLEPSRGLGPQ